MKKFVLKINKMILILMVLVTFYLSLFAGEYGSWKPFTNLPQLDFRVRRVEFNSDAKKYEWHVIFRNRYDKTINFDYCLNETGIRKGGVYQRTTLRAGAEEKSIYHSGGFFLLKTEDRPEVCVQHVRFGDDDSGPYATHD